MTWTEQSSKPFRQTLLILCLIAIGGIVNTFSFYSSYLSYISSVIKVNNDDVRPTQLTAKTNETATWTDINDLSCAPLPREHRYRLELLHIPKTGGSALEIVAAQHHIAWGICHWKYTVLNRIPCPPHPNRPPLHPVHKTPFWHLPMPWIDWDFQSNSSVSILNPPTFNPYILKNVVVFAVVRNPYSRMVSQWNFEQANMEALGYNRSNAQHMNEFLQHTLQSLRNATPAMLEYFCHDGHFIPQYEYIFSHNYHRRNTIASRQKNIIVLRNENLKSDFACLMRRHRMSHLQLPKEHWNSGTSKLTDANLTVETKKLIEEIYHKDFEAFGYPKMSELS